MKPSSRFLKVLRRLLLGVALATTAIALFVTVENWRGDRAWAEVERDLKSRGELHSISVTATPPIPDEQNFFQAPLLARLLYGRPDDPERKKFLSETRLREIYDWPNLGPQYASDDGRARLFSSRDFPTIRRILRQRGFVAAPDSDSPVADLLLALEPLRPLLDEVRDAAGSRPQAALRPEMFAPTSQNPLSVDFGIIKGLGTALAARADLELELGHVADASTDILALLRLGNELSAPSESSTWVSLVTGISLFRIAAPIIARGLESRLWNESQLAAIERLLGQLRPLPTVQAARRNERATMLSFMDAQSAQDPRYFPRPFWFFHGFAQLNKVTYSRAVDRELIGVVTIAPDRIFLRPSQIYGAPFEGTLAWLASKFRNPNELRRLLKKLEPLRHPYSWMTETVFRGSDQILQRLGSSIDHLALLRISCAFERHRLAAGAFPEKLDDLVPKFLPAVPTGIFDGQPLQLRKAPEGGYEIYFFGRDGRDDQGKGDDISLKIPAP